MDWLGATLTWMKDNLAVLSAIFVPLVVAIIGPITSREAGGRLYRRVRRHAQLRSLLTDSEQAAAHMDGLLDHETKQLAQRHTRRVNVPNLAVVAFITVVGAAVVFGLATWAQATDGFLAVALWGVVAAWSLFVLLLVLVGGIPNFYHPDAEKAGADPVDGTVDN